MTRVVRGTIATLAFMVLAAHFLRGGLLTFAFFSLLLPLTMLTPGRGWAIARGIVLSLGGLLLYVYSVGDIRGRMLEDEPWVRYAVIMGTVLVLVIVAAVGEFGRPRPGNRAEPGDGRGPRRAP
jgi:hypothetical protein